MKLKGIRLSDIEDKKKRKKRKRRILYKFTYMGSKKANLRDTVEWRIPESRDGGNGEILVKEYKLPVVKLTRSG